MTQSRRRAARDRAVDADNAQCSAPQVPQVGQFLPHRGFRAQNAVHVLGEDDAGGGEANAPPVTLEQGAIQRPLKGRNLSADNRDIEIQNSRPLPTSTGRRRPPPRFDNHQAGNPAEALRGIQLLDRSWLCLAHSTKLLAVRSVADKPPGFYSASAISGNGRESMLKAVIAACAFVFAVFLTDAAQAQSTGTKVLSVAEVYEPQTLDPTTSTADLISVVTQGAFETLYTYDQNWQTVPMLAAAMPETSADGKTVTIKLRTNVPFHDGTIMTADDVVASLLRWQKLSPRGKIAAAATESISAKGADTVEIKLKAPFSPLVSLLSFFNSAAAILPKAKAEAAMNGPITDTTQLVGTGPFRIVERKPDQYVRLTKFDRYASLSRRLHYMPESEKR